MSELAQWGGFRENLFTDKHTYIVSDRHPILLFETLQEAKKVLKIGWIVNNYPDSKNIVDNLDIEKKGLHIINCVRATHSLREWQTNW